MVQLESTNALMLNDWDVLSFDYKFNDFTLDIQILDGMLLSHSI